MALTSFIRYVRLTLITSLFFLSIALSAKGQEKRFYRVWLIDKGTPNRLLLPSDPWYPAATSHLTERALKRRAKVLPLDSLVSTADLPIHEEYRQKLLDLGIEIRQTSRWFNTAMIFTDSATFELVRTLPFVDSTEKMFSNQVSGPPIAKRLLSPPIDFTTPGSIEYRSNDCITLKYGSAENQNREVMFQAPHSMGIAGEGVLIGILDAGFDWRSHNLISNANVVAEYDFVNNDSITYDEEGEQLSEPHGTYVMSVIAGNVPNNMVGGAFRASFALAKTEDVRSERHIEEDNFVAGLEWLESLGVDVTNTSLGYTTFDPPEAPHRFDGDMDGKTAFGSRGVNLATRLGVVCVLAAGNEFTSFRYVSVPAEADSAIAVAALKTPDIIAPFSSRGSTSWDRLKPDVAAPGVEIYGAQPNAPNAVGPSQGTSSAAPLTTALVALMLSANPKLTPWEIREALFATSQKAANPDTTFGRGLVDANAALSYLSKSSSFAGEPILLTYQNSLSVISWIVSGNPAHIDIPEFSTPFHPILLRLTNLRTLATLTSNEQQPEHGLAQWIVIGGVETLGIVPEDELLIEIIEPTSNRLLRSTVLRATEELALPVSTLCKTPPLPITSLATARPNPFYDATRIEYVVDREALISLDIFAITGERVLNLLKNKRHSPGFYSELLIPNDLPSGAYYYRLQVDDDVFYEKMIRLR
ncbi:MAG: S8 family peptidase [Ignavibacteriae bacterium]|nr:S8 family peptidase [Ignavibacteriota bacterium]MCB9217071.1 S8 family peptidase [Ignavibacteria bacterium]